MTTGSQINAAEWWGSSPKCCQAGETLAFPSKAHTQP